MKTQITLQIYELEDIIKRAKSACQNNSDYCNTVEIEITKRADIVGDSDSVDVRIPNRYAGSPSKWIYSNKRR